jgi:rod shape-determining protein MreD
MNVRRDRPGPVILSIVAAMLLTILPLPPMLNAAQPYWVALVLVYWCLETRDIITLGSAFLVGLVLDLLTGSLLGMHALSLVILVYLVTRFRARLRFFPPWQQALSVLALLLNDRIILLWIVSLRGDSWPSLGFWLAPVIGTIFWPWVFLLLDRYRSALRHRASQ